MWRIFNKKNRNYTIAGVVAFVIAVYVVWKYVLPERWQAWFKSFVADPSGAVLGGAGWEAATRGEFGRGPIKVGEGAGLSSGSPIDITSN